MVTQATRWGVSVVTIIGPRKFLESLCSLFYNAGLEGCSSVSEGSNSSSRGINSMARGRQGEQRLDKLPSETAISSELPPEGLLTIGVGLPMAIRAINQNNSSVEASYLGKSYLVVDTKPSHIVLGQNLKPRFVPPWELHGEPIPGSVPWAMVA